MDDLTRDDFERYLKEQKEWTDEIRKLNSMPRDIGTSTTSGNMTLTVNAGGWSVLILLVLSAFVLGISVMSSFSSASRMNNIERRQDRQDDYLQAIYSIAPQLKPKETSK